MKHKKKGLKRLLSLALIPTLPLLCIAFPLLREEAPAIPYTAPTAAVLYAEPDRGSKILCTLTPGSTATAYEALEGGWQRLETADGLSGYIWTAGESAAEAAALPDSTPRPIKTDPIPYTLTCAAALFRRADKESDVLKHLNNEDKLELTGAVKNGMVMAKLPDGTLGFLDSAVIDEAAAGELISILSGNRSPRGVQNLFSAENMLLPFADRLALLRELFPGGRYWNTLGFDTAGLSQEWAVTLTTDRPCAHADNGFQYCQSYTGKAERLFPDDSALQDAGFAAMASDFLYGKDAPTRTHQDLAALQPGDIIRFESDGQYIFVTAVTKTAVKAGLCNSDGENCKIIWDKEFLLKDLEVKKRTIVSRTEA